MEKKPDKNTIIAIAGLIIEALAATAAWIAAIR